VSNAISIFGGATQSKSSVITSEGRTNVYFDIQDSPDRAPVAAYGTPGATLLHTLSSYPSRGLYFMQSKGVLISVNFNKVYAINAQNVIIFTGELPNADDYLGSVSMADNGNQLLIITNTHGYCISVTGLFTTFTIVDITGVLPANGATNCCYLDGYFVVGEKNSQKFYISHLYDGLLWDALDFASAEASPDTLNAVYALNGYLYLLGYLTTELWANSGDPLFPFTRVQGAMAKYGSVTPHTLSAKDDIVVGLYQNRLGQLSVGALSGTNFTPLSSPDIDYWLNKYKNPELGRGFVYSLNGRYFYQITFPNDERTWLYDFKSFAWTSLSSWGSQFSIVGTGASYFSNIIVSDRTTGNLYRLSADVFTENGAQIVREIVFNQVFADSQNFTLVSRVRAWFETGQGLVDPDAQGYNPTVYLQVSRDAGHTWGSWMQTTLGKIGNYTDRAEWRRLGQARTWSFKVRMTDPVKFVLTDIALLTQEANQ
jgi:hypothetical protein